MILLSGVRVFKFLKSKWQSFLRLVSRYEQGDYALLRQEVAWIGWIFSPESWQRLCQISNWNIYRFVDKFPEQSAHNTPIRSTKDDIMCKEVYVLENTKSVPRSKMNKNHNGWNTFKGMQNKTISIIRNSNKALYTSIANKVNSVSLSPKQGWPSLNSFQSPISQVSTNSL